MCVDNKEKIREIANKLSFFTIPIYFVNNQESLSPGGILKNATGVLIDTGKKHILVTCEHVWSAFEEERLVNKNLVLGFGRGNGERLVFINPQLIDMDKDYDIAVFDFNFKDIFGKKAFYSSDYWPPSVPAVKDAVFLLGYPGQYRNADATRLGIFSAIVGFADFVSSVSERNIILADEKNVRELREFMEGYPAIWDLGGMSGGPVFVKRNNNYELIGIMRAADTGPHATIFVAPLYYISSDGTLDFSQRPQL